MAKYLVFSDSHGQNDNMLEIIREQNKDIEGVIHLGDIEGDISRLQNAVSGSVYIVRGNCDWSSRAPESQVVCLHGHTIALTHGHRQRVNYGIDVLKYWAMEKKADIVMYGHTHVPFLEQSYALTVLNPGSISRPRQSDYRKTYAVVEFLKHGEVNTQICYA